MLTPQEQEGRNTAEGTEETKQAAKTPVAKKDSPVVKKVSPDAKKAASAAKSSAAQKEPAEKDRIRTASSQKTASPKMQRKKAPVNAVMEESLAPETLEQRGKKEAAPSPARLPESAVLEDSLRHGRHVAILVASLFDQLAELHSLDEIWRKRLVLAARLHDIGFAEGRKGHHKASMRCIEEDRSLNISDADRPLIALLALIASAGTPAAPGAGAVILFTILSGVGFTNDGALLAYAPQGAQGFTPGGRFVARRGRTGLYS